MSTVTTSFTRALSFNGLVYPTELGSSHPTASQGEPANFQVPPKTSGTAFPAVSYSLSVVRRLLACQAPSKQVVSVCFSFETIQNGFPVLRNLHISDIVRAFRRLHEAGSSGADRRPGRWTSCKLSAYALKLQVKPPGIGPQVLVLGGIYQGKPFWAVVLTHSQMITWCCIQWMDKIPSHHFETMVETIVCWFLPGESSFQGFSGGAAFRPSTVL